MGKFGFVYIWFDRKHTRFYIGSHWGTEKDGYICSSRWMRKAYKRRPQDFHRRIVQRTNCRNDLLELEYNWLCLIKPEELGRRYYNLHQRKSGHWTTSSDKRTISQKISDSHRSNPNWGSWRIGKKQSVEHRRKHSEAKKGKRLSPLTEFQIGNIPWNKDKTGLVIMSEETKQKMREASTGRIHSEETKQKMRDRPVLDKTKEKLRIANIGKKHSEESKQKMSEAHKGKILSEETKRKIGKASKGHTLSPEARKRISDAQKGVNNDPRSLEVEFEGIQYGSLRSAAKASGKNYHYIRKHAKRI